VRVAAAFGNEWKRQVETASTKLSPAVRDGVMQAVSKLGKPRRTRPPPRSLSSEGANVAAMSFSLFHEAAAP
jgi:hypothetical protein